MQELVNLMDPDTEAMWRTATLGYGQSRGNASLRAEIAATYTSVEPDGVHVFSGATEAVFAAMHVLVEPGDHAIVVTPI